MSDREFKLTPICERCNAFLWEWEKKPHRCQPRYEVIYYDYDPEHIFAVYASDIESAVERWAEAFDQDGQSHIANGSPVEVMVRAPKNRVWTKWRVTGKWVAEYQAECAE